MSPPKAQPQPDAWPIGVGEDEYDPPLYDDDDPDDDVDDLEKRGPEAFASMRDDCVLGAECLNPNLFHRSDECFDLEMAEHFHGA